MAEVTRGLLDTSVVIAHTEEGLGAALPEELAISIATLRRGAGERATDTRAPALAS